MTLTISPEQGRRAVLALQGLSEPPRRKLGHDELVGLVERLGFVQIDSINRVERAHQMILFSRNETYRPELLRRAVEDRAALFEHWTHDASIIPARFFPYWQHKFRRDTPRLAERFKVWHGSAFAKEIDNLLARIESDGPLASRDVRGEDAPESGGWWNWHPGKAALEYLWRTGRLGIARRQGFQKVYDLIERVVPETHRQEPPHEEAFIDWACRSALERLGFGTPTDISRFWALVTPEEAQAWCRAAGPDAALPATVEVANGTRPQTVYCRPDLPGLLRDLPDPPARLRVLNPFDPVLRDRRRLKRLFDYDYRIEVFVPAEKRKYGYYVFPLLEGDRLIGRIDMVASREADRLEVSALWLEPGVKLGSGRMARLEAELERIARFAGVTSITFTDDWRKIDS